MKKETPPRRGFSLLALSVTPSHCGGAGREIMIRQSIGLVAIALLGAITPAAALEPKPLNLDMTEGWKHPKSGLFFPKQLNSLPHKTATEFVEGGWDVALQYYADVKDYTVSVYVYQAAVQDVGLLFSESRKSIESRKDVFGTAVPAAAAARFTPPEQNSASGLRIVYNTNGAYKSTGIAIAPLGRSWIVKFRVSSRTKTTAELEASLTEAITTMGWPADILPHPSPSETSACTSALIAFGEAKTLKSKTTYALENALMAVSIAKTMDEKKAPQAKTPVYCVDKSVNFPYSIYRPDNAQDRYLISLGDSGKAVFVEPDRSRKMRVADGDKDAENAYAISMTVPGSTDFYPSHDRMPSPEQVVKIINTMSRLSRTGRGDGDTDIKIDSSLMKEPKPSSK
jgi:hypothetical protein